MKNTHSFVNLSPTLFLERSGLAFPDNVAVTCGGTEVNYSTLLSRSRKLADMLHGLGVSYGDHIGLLTQNSIQGIEAHFAIPGSGGVIVSLNPWLSGDDLAKQLSFAEVTILLVSQQLYHQHAALIMSIKQDIRVVVIDSDDCDDSNVLCASRHLQYCSDLIPLDRYLQSENDPVAMNFTSGTTGQPKGVLYSHRAAYLHAMGQVLMLGLQRDSRYYWSLPMFHVNGWGHMWAVPVVGATQYISTHETHADSATIVSDLIQHRVTHLAGAPRLIKAIASDSAIEYSLDRLTILTGGAAPTPDLVQSMFSKGIDLIHQYGLNETCGPFVVCEKQTHWNDIDTDTRNALCLRQGVPAIHAGYGLKVVSEQGDEVPSDGVTMGEVIVKGNTVATEYFNNPEATATSFRQGWFYSGDIAVRHPDGYIQIKDRIKDIIHVTTDYGWENISTIEIENAISRLEGIADIAIIGVTMPDSVKGQPREDQCIVAFYEGERATPISISDLRDRCSKILPAYKVPAFFIAHDIPKTATGKIKKHELTDIFLTHYVNRQTQGRSAPAVEEVT